MDPRDRPPLRLLDVVRALDAAGVRWVLTGSTVLAIYGADLVPNDVDVTPALEPDNLAALAGVLADLDAVVAYDRSWPDGPPLAECLAWRPEPPTEDNLDHLFVTRAGLVDVPPRVCGTYAELAGGATTVRLGGLPVRACDPDEVLGRLRGRTRGKDVQRAAAYDAVRRHVTISREPVGVQRLLERLAG